jgi:hypothetical protein
MCPEFQNLGLKVITSAELTKPKESVHFQKSKNPKPLKDRLTWQQKQKWPQTNKVFNSVAVNPRRRSEKSTHKRNFRQESRLEKESCKRKPKYKKGSCNKRCVSSFDEFNEKFRLLASNTVYCKCFDLMHALSQHLHSPACHISHPKSKNKYSKGKNGQNGSSERNDKTKTENAKADSKTPNKTGPIWKWVPKSL